ncbi:MAG: DUF3375 domain-containing protein [Candidatus Melainabacteria bacterium]|nr:DUF3375 domain-containing protein [Candidatus Melainabacteria bacterium]
MQLDYTTLEALRHSHPSWRLLRADQAPLVACFLQRVFIIPNVRVIPQSVLVEALEDELFALNDRLGPKTFPKKALDYLNDWAANDKGWLRKFYRAGSDEPHFDLTPSTEKAILWLTSLTERTFVGTESRLLTLFELLKQMSEGTETDPQLRIAELEKRRDEINSEIARITGGDLRLLDDAGLKDRFQQFVSVARELLTDFREVEHNFRNLDRKVREQIALWEGGKGALLEQIMGERDAISDSDQGRSFHAFWDFLMSSRRQEELTQLLERVLALPAITATNPDARLRRIHYDWLEAGEHTQRTVATLSQQLRKFLDDAAWLENRRIMDILRNIEVKAIELRDHISNEEMMSLEDVSVDIELPLERPLYVPKTKFKLNAHIVVQSDDEEINTDALFSNIFVDTALLAKHIRQMLRGNSQITLCDLIEKHPLKNGLAEVLAYFQLATGGAFDAVISEEETDIVEWQYETGKTKQATIPRIIFVR